MLARHLSSRSTRLLRAASSLAHETPSDPLPSLSPTAQTVTTTQLMSLVDHVDSAKRLVVLTGAGISTASGIPDYRSPQGSYSRGHKPIQNMEFIKSESKRRRYWARSFVGWKYFSRARPNLAHLALAELETCGRLDGGVVTQNVDGLHSQAGQSTVVDLHGRIDEVHCLGCGERTPRRALQDRLRSANDVWVAAMASRLSVPVELRADGDTELTEEECAAFAVPPCTSCGGVLMPGVTFFGGSVPKEKVEAASAAVASADAMLVIGSSLQVFSAFRLARQAAERQIPILILNNGPTRADELVPPDMRLACDACEVLPELLRYVQ